MSGTRDAVEERPLLPGARATRPAPQGPATETNGHARAVGVSDRRLDGFDLAILALFVAMSLFVLVLDVWQVVAHHRVWTGTEGGSVVDHLQYLAWIRDAANHGLASNLFVLRHTPHDYFQPAVQVSAGLAALGVAPWVALLIWKPVAVLGIFFVVRAYTRRTLTGRWSRRAALVLALFGGTYAFVLQRWMGTLVDQWLPFWTWGYVFGLLSLTAMTAGLLSYERGRNSGCRLWLAPALGMLASSLHPWQGEVMIATVVGAEGLLWLRGERGRLGLAAATVVVSGLPLIYYAILGWADPNWGTAHTLSREPFSLLRAVLPLLPLALPALLAYRRRIHGFLPLATRLWPAAMVAVFLVSDTPLGGVPLHAFAGATIPLGILAVEGVGSLDLARARAWRLVALAAVLVATIPVTVNMLLFAHHWILPAQPTANFITRDEERALDYLARTRAPGGVLAWRTLGVLVPAETGRRTYFGARIWVPYDWARRKRVVWGLFFSARGTPAARALVRASGARFVLAGCQRHVDLERRLGPLIEATHHFGCATVYNVS